MTSRVVNAKRLWLCDDCDQWHLTKVKSCQACGCKNLTYFQSKKEATRWRDLKTLEKAGEISNLSRQIVFPFTCAIGTIETPTGRTMTHTVDFEYLDNRNGKLTLEDAKGFDTDMSHIKRELVKIMFGRTITIY